MSSTDHLDSVKRIWYLSPVRAAKVQASLRIRAVSPEPSLLAHTSSESRGTFRLKARSLAPLNGWACAVTTCHDGMLEDTNSLDGAHLRFPVIVLNGFQGTIWEFIRKTITLENGKANKLTCVHSKNSVQSGQSLRCQPEEGLGPKLPITRTTKTGRMLERETCLSPTVIYYWPFQGGASVIVYSHYNCV